MMVKIRYFKVRFSCEFSTLIKSFQKSIKFDSSIALVDINDSQIVFNFSNVRSINIRKFIDGEEFIDSVLTVDTYLFRFFQTKNSCFLSVIDPPRGVGIITKLMDQVLGAGQFFIEALEITPELVSRHVKQFESAVLVSAKIRDFEVYPGAIGRLEITSKDGLKSNIAPFLENKFHRIDSVTYELTRNFTQGLVYYYRNGMVRVSSPLVAAAFPAFEACLD